MADVEAMLQRVAKHKGVVGVLVASDDGAVHKSTLDERATAEYAARVPGLAALARSLVRELDPQDDVTFVRVRGAKGHELMIAPKNEYVLVVVQDVVAALAP